MEIIVVSSSFKVALNYVSSSEVISLLASTKSLSKVDENDQRSGSFPGHAVWQSFLRKALGQHAQKLSTDSSDAREEGSDDAVQKARSRLQKQYPRS